MAISKKTRLSRVVWGFIAIGGGGIVPAFLFFIVDYNSNGVLLEPNMKILFTKGLVILLISFFLTMSAALIKTEKGQDALLWASGLGSLFSLNLFVLATGGPTQSVFAFHYLYIPVVVALHFSRGQFVWAALLCWITYGANLWYVRRPSQLELWAYAAKVCGYDSYLLLFGGIFTLQMFMTIAIYFLPELLARIETQTPEPAAAND